MIRNLKRQKYEALRNTTVDLKESKCNFGLPLSVLLGHRRGLRCSLPRGPLRCAGLHYGTIQLKTYCFCLSCTRGGAPSFRSDLYISKKKKGFRSDLEYHSPHRAIKSFFIFFYYMCGRSNSFFLSKILSALHVVVHQVLDRMIPSVMWHVSDGAVPFPRIRAPPPRTESNMKERQAALAGDSTSQVIDRQMDRSIRIPRPHARGACSHQWGPPPPSCV